MDLSQPTVQVLHILALPSQPHPTKAPRGGVVFSPAAALPRGEAQSLPLLPPCPGGRRSLCPCCRPAPGEVLKWNCFVLLFPLRPIMLIIEAMDKVLLLVIGQVSNS